MPNYRNGKIYLIFCLLTGEIYIGSTTQSLALRIGQHVQCNKQWKKGKGCRLTSFVIIDRGVYRIELIESFPCDSKEELHAREGHHIRNMDCVNKNTPGRTQEMIKTYQDEYRENHKEQNKEYKKKYREDNKEKLNATDRKYYNENKQKVNEYREANRDRLLQQKREHATLKRAQKYTCDCGSCVCLTNKSNHDKTNKHKEFLLAK
jgi:hypothetical protein